MFPSTEPKAGFQFDRPLVAFPLQRVIHSTVPVPCGRMAGFFGEAGVDKDSVRTALYIGVGIIVAINFLSFALTVIIT